VRTISGLTNSLTATLFLEPNDTTIPDARRALTERAGRILYNGYPTGVAVSWAQNHGGSWPSTNSIHTSVGASSIRRFLRPVAWQNAPQSELPLELQDDYADIPRRIDGALTLPSAPIAL
jgi:NADP-dependent aldehyde dehydrogenase